MTVTIGTENKPYSTVFLNNVIIYLASHQAICIYTPLTFPFLVTSGSECNIPSISTVSFRAVSRSLSCELTFTLKAFRRSLFETRQLPLPLPLEPQDSASECELVKPLD